MDVVTGMVPLVVAVSASAIAAFTDVRRFKVYNLLTIPMLLSGLAYHVATGGWMGATTSAAGVAIGLGLLLIPYLIGGMGAGDVKFLMSLGAWLGPWPLIPIFVVGAMATAIYAIVLSAIGRNLSMLWWNLKVSILRLILMGKLLAAEDCREDFHDYVDRKDRHKHLIPFSAMLGLGLVVSLVWVFNLHIQ